MVDTTGADNHGHGTKMAGLALYGPLDDHLLSSEPVVLLHRLESVKILPDAPAQNDPLTYGVVTAQATAAAETVAPDRRRAFCLPVSSQPEGRPGEPSTWSASIDALSAGSGIDQSDTGIALLDTPEPDAARLFLIDAGHVGVRADVDYLDACDTELVEDPTQSWNALTVGAYTTLTACPSDVAFTDWSPMAATGDLSPFSRTSVRFAGSWPIKPDICMEGGNVLTNGHDVADAHSVCSLATTGTGGDLTLATANATSAATAQAARLASRAMAVYPSFWPETIRGLLVHVADWTPAMSASIDAATRKKKRSALLRRYGWGVPTDSGVLESTANAVTLVTQDRFIPFDDQHAARHFRLHRLPWPADELLNLVETPVQLRVTLSYFIEPNARG